MIIDAHHHLETREGYVEELIENAQRLRIGKVCLFGAGRASSLLGIANNDAVLAAAEKYPDIIVPFAVFDLGLNPPEEIATWRRRGFKGIKFINPLDNYDSKAFYPVYERMEELRMPGLFHLGIVANVPGMNVYDINNNRHRPVYLDTIARAFPKLKIIGAHLGNPWYEEAAMVARWNPNVYFDLTGSTMKSKTPNHLGELLWWTPETRYRDPLRRHAWEKIVFGTDVPAGEMRDVYNDYQFFMDTLRVPDKVRLRVWGGNMMDILDISPT